MSLVRFLMKGVAPRRPTQLGATGARSPRQCEGSTIQALGRTLLAIELSTWNRKGPEECSEVHLASKRTIYIVTKQAPQVEQHG